MVSSAATSKGQSDCPICPARVAQWWLSNCANQLGQILFPWTRVVCASRWEKRRTRALKFCSIISSIRSSTRNRRSLCGYLFWSTVQCRTVWRTAAKTSNTARALVVKGAKRGNSNERRDCGTCHVIDGVVGRAINLILGDYILNILCCFFFVNEILFPCASCCKKDFIDKNVALHILQIRNHRRMKCRVIHWKRKLFCNDSEGTIHILCQHNFRLFLTHPPKGVKSVLNVSKTGNFPDPPTATQSFFADVIYGWSLM